MSAHRPCCFLSRTNLLRSEEKSLYPYMIHAAYQRPTRRKKPDTLLARVAEPLAPMPIIAFEKNSNCRGDDHIGSVCHTAAVIKTYMAAAEGDERAKFLDKLIIPSFRMPIIRHQTSSQFRDQPFHSDNFSSLCSILYPRKADNERVGAASLSFYDF